MPDHSRPKKTPANIRDYSVQALYRLVSDYSDWYEEHGVKLPPDFATDPTAWTVCLQKMKRAFCLLHDEQNGSGPLWNAKHKWAQFGEVDSEEIKDLEQEIHEGLSLFGKYLYYMQDEHYLLPIDTH